MTSPAPSLGTYVYNELLNQISRGEFPVNSRLPSEERLAKTYQVSRPIIREALARLREDGVIQSRRGAGSFVIRGMQPLLEHQDNPVEDWSDFLQCYEFRTVLEGNIAYLAAQRATDDDKRAIALAHRHVYEEYYKNTSATDPHSESNMDRDYIFHTTVARATHNPYYVSSLEALLGQMKQSMFLITKVFRSHQERHATILREEHSWVVNAILSGNPEQARAAMILHIQNARDSIIPTEHTNQMQGLADTSSTLRRK